MTTIFPTIRYADGRGAVEFLKAAFGFAEHEVMVGDDGTIGHGELRLGDAFVMVGSHKDDRFATSGTQLVYVAVDGPEDIDALHARAVEAGAEIVMEPTDTDYGSRDFSAKDPEGNIWSFGTYAPKP